MLEVGNFFKKGNKEYGVLDIIQYQGQEYYYFSVEENNKLDYNFYILKSYNENSGYDFELVNDKMLYMKLFDIEVQKLKETI